MYRIMYRYGNGPSEEIDSMDDIEYAKIMLNETKMAYKNDPKARVWIECDNGEII